MSSTVEYRSLGENRILAALSPEHRQHLCGGKELLTLSPGDVILETAGSRDYVYFPFTSVVALTYEGSDGATAVVGVVGNEGAIGRDLLLQSDTAFHRAVVLLEGHALGVAAEALREELMLVNSHESLLLRYTRILMVQLAQSAVCNRFHTVEKRLCRWLLFLRERVRSDDLWLTQNALAAVVNARRETVSASLRRLRDLGLIRHRFGRTTIVDRANLETRACECYRLVESEIDRLLGTRQLEAFR
jgi:CRP-like cAMP-binding protein